MKPKHYQCSFCGQIRHYPYVVIRGPEISKRRANICEDCVSVCTMIVIANSHRYPKKKKP